MKLPDFDSLWDYDHPAETEKKFRELLQQTEESGDTSYYLQLLTQLARTLGLQRRFDQAHEVLDKIEPKLTNDLKLARVRYLLERGRTLNSSGLPEKAKPLFLEAWELGKQNEYDNFAIDAAHMIAITENTDEALKWNEKAVDYAEKSKDENARKWLGSLYNNIGWNYHDKKEYEKAYDYFKKDFEWFSDKNRPVQLRIAKWSMARTLRSMNKFSEALNMQREILNGINENSEEQDGYVLEEIGECLFALKREDESKPYFSQAFDLLSKDTWLSANELSFHCHKKFGRSQRYADDPRQL
jgi:tetratricopeptide (TPR) repeat protein